MAAAGEWVWLNFFSQLLLLAFKRLLSFLTQSAQLSVGTLGIGMCLAGVAEGHSFPPLSIPPTSAAPLRPDPRRRIDSVAALVRAHPQPDTVRAVLLMNLAEEIAAVDARAAGPVIRQALRLTEQLRYRDLLAEALLCQADYYTRHEMGCESRT